MHSSVSVIITTKNSSSTLRACLASIAEQTYPNGEIIVVDNASTDATKAIASEFTPHVFDFGPERSAQRNHGVRESHGEYVLIIDSDMQLAPDVVAGCVQALEEHTEWQAITIPEVSFGEGFWAKCKAFERSFYVDCPWMQGARFFRKSVFEAVGGYDESNTGTEDFDLPNRIREQYGDTAIGYVKMIIRHDERHLSLLYTCRKKYYYSQRLAAYQRHAYNQSFFKKQANPLQRFGLFFSHPSRLLKNPIIALGMLTMKTCEFIAGGCGYLVGVWGTPRQSL